MTLPDEKRLAEIRARLDAASPGPWSCSSSSLICSAPLIQDEEDAPDYPETPRPGPPFFTDEDNAWLEQRSAAYEADSCVAWVPAHYGDTATGRHAADAAFIEGARADIPYLLERLTAERDDALADAARLRAALVPVSDSATLRAVGGYPQQRVTVDHEAWNGLMRAALGDGQGDAG